MSLFPHKNELDTDFSMCIEVHVYRLLSLYNRKDVKLNSAINVLAKYLE